MQIITNQLVYSVTMFQI